MPLTSTDWIVIVGYLLVNLLIAASVTLGIGILIFRRLKPRFYEHI